MEPANEIERANMEGQLASMAAAVLSSFHSPNEELREGAGRFALELERFFGDRPQPAAVSDLIKVYRKQR